MIYMKNEFYIKCSCTEHVLNIEKDTELKQYFISIFSLDHSKLNIFQRIKFAFEYLFKGSLFKDQIVLNENSIDELITNLENIKNA